VNNPAALNASALVATACDHVTGGAAGELVEVGFSHIVQLKTQLTGQLGHVPEHIAKLQLERFTHLRREGAALIAQHLLHLVGHFPRLTTEAEGGVDGVGSHIRIAGCAAGPLLVGIEIHWQNRAGGSR